ncbi:hypothetical protein [Sphingomonas oryzagri]|uniref:Uncharacterized protein n=1 Tax=Sphingomonas oryzagri TaxID=3042314 RepID=A0ABT6N2C5_9SPHN|nr:hypothetical protein [Sphingomonas oryzagri]MDH7639382.1 hypothetical protein [Sphingomonas oryzagri]
MDKRRRDIDYYTQRLADAERLAETTQSASARLVHADLARLYRERLSDLQGTRDGGEGSEANDRGSHHDG